MNDSTNDVSLPIVALRSVRSFFGMAARRSLRLRRDRIGALYAIEDAGTYRIFRETVATPVDADDPSVLVVGFRLRGIRSVAALHWLFQRCCILTTPFWSGFPGFRVKLWMVEPAAKDYLGIYSWNGAGDAQHYVDALVRVLRPLSTDGSVWYRLLPGETLEAYLQLRARGLPGSAGGRMEEPAGVRS
jgi:hypothetical protein